MHILIVEDSAACSQYYSLYLQTFAQRLVCANSLNEAKALVTATATPPIDGVILDQFLPDGLGLELMACLRQHHPQAAVVMVSANDNPAFWLEAFEQGIDDYIIKPPNLQLLWVKLNRSIQQKHQAWQQQQEQQQRLHAETQEQWLTKCVLDSLSRALIEKQEFIRSYSLPHGLFSGDIVLHQQSQDGSRYLLLADAMGHGLAAAVSLIPVLQIFQAMSFKGFPLADLALELNNKLARQLPDDRFVSAILLQLHPASQQLSIWNGGMPPVILINENHDVELIKSDNLPLGIMVQTAAEMQLTQRSLTSINRLIALSDGVTEIPHGKDGYLSYAQIAQFWHPDIDTGFDALLNYLNGIEKQDDLTITEIDCKSLCKKP